MFIGSVKVELNAGVVLRYRYKYVSLFHVVQVQSINYKVSSILVRHLINTSSRLPGNDALHVLIM